MQSTCMPLHSLTPYQLFSNESSQQFPFRRVQYNLLSLLTPHGRVILHIYHHLTILSTLRTILTAQGKIRWRLRLLPKSGSFQIYTTDSGLLLLFVQFSYYGKPLNKGDCTWIINEFLNEFLGEQGADCSVSQKSGF